MSYEVKDSGSRREFATGAVRDMGGGKGRTDLLPFFALLELSKHMEAGAEKYGDDNWRKGIPLRVYLDSAIRHLFKFALGMRDERHDLAALWNIACLIETQNMIDRGIVSPTLGDLPDWHDPHTEPFGITEEEHAAMPWAGVMPGAYGCDDNAPLPVPEVGEDVEPLDAYLGELFPDDPGTGPVPNPQGNYPLDLRPQDREFPGWSKFSPTGKPGEYTRGHAEDTAARFNAGQSYADDSAPVEMDTMNFTGNADLLAAEAIADNAMFHVGVIDGPDAAEYDGPETCVIHDDCNCHPTDPLAGQPWVVVRTPNREDERRWLVTALGVSFSPARGKPFIRSHLDRATIRRGIIAGRKVVDLVGVGATDE